MVAEAVGRTFVDDSVAPLLSPPGEPFVAAELQRHFTGMSARDVYTLLCKRNGCHAIGTVLKLLPEKPGVWDVQSLDLSTTYVGARGAIVVAELCKLLGGLVELSLADNYLSNDSVWHLCKMAQHHPSLHSLDVSGNPISWIAGMCLLELATRNSRVRRIGMRDTALKPKVVESISGQLRRNASAGGRGVHRGPKPCNHATTVRQRGIHRFFLEACEKTNRVSHGTLPRSYLIDGVRELWKLSGRPPTATSPTFVEEMQSRASGDYIGWEEFMLLVMLEDVSFDEAAVATLRQTFQRFDHDGQKFVCVSDLPEILQELSHGAAVTAEEVGALMDVLDLDKDMTLTWDEFLLLLIDRGPVVGEASVLHTHTPLRQHRSFHR